MKSTLKGWSDIILTKICEYCGKEKATHTNKCRCGNPKTKIQLCDHCNDEWEKSKSSGGLQCRE